MENADEGTLLFTACTTNRSDNPKQECLNILEKAMTRGYESLLTRHIEEYRAFFSRVKLDLGEDVELIKLPTDKRLKRMQAGESDDNLFAAYFDYGRYLLIACSRPNGMVPTLQGMWNKDMQPPWDSKYTININTEMKTPTLCQTERPAAFARGPLWTIRYCASCSVTVSRPVRF